MWKDWTTAVLGLWLAVSPWVIGAAARAPNVGMLWNCVLTGGLIVVFAGWSVASPKDAWQEFVVLLLGVWLLIAPGTLRYEIPSVTWDNVLVGLVAAILAIWSLSERWPTSGSRT